MTKRCVTCHAKRDIECFFKDGKELKSCQRCRVKCNEKDRAAYHERGVKNYAQQKAYRQQLFAQPLPEGHKRCHECLGAKELEQFITPGGERKFCHTCRAKISADKKKYIASLSGEKRQRYLDARKNNRILRKRVVVDGYGGKCVCCGESHIQFLTIDHPDKNGGHDRKVNKNWSSTLYRKLIKQGFPNTFRCLCFNCNWAYHMFNECPHQKETTLY